MRRPIQIQLLVPTLSVVVLAIVLASGASGYFGAMRQRQSQEESLRRVVATLTEGRFPLTESVLQQMSGLSGAEFVFLDTNQKVLASTLCAVSRTTSGGWQAFPSASNPGKPNTGRWARSRAWNWPAAST